MTALESRKAVKIRGHVLGYFQPDREPVDLTNILDAIQNQVDDVSDSEVRDVILRLIGSGKLMYTPDMRISLGK